MKILIIEDDKNLAAVLEQFLQPVSTQITIAHTMEQALKAVTEAEDIELITLDLGLPDSDIESTVEKIADLRKLKPKSLIIIVTGHTIEGLEKRAMERGADGVVLKQNEEFTPRGFLTIIAKIAEKYLKDPQPPSRSIELLEKVSNRVAQFNAQAAASTAA